MILGSKADSNVAIEEENKEEIWSICKTSLEQKMFITTKH